MNLQSIVNGSDLYWIPSLVTENLYIFFSELKKKNEKISIEFLSFWRHGRVVRRGTANPFSPVQIRVSPQQKT